MRREDWDRRYAERGLLWSATPNRVLVSEAAGLAPGHALDLACGEGRNAIWLAECGFDVTAVDFSDVAIAKACRRAARVGVEVEFLCADLLEYTPQRNAFDLVLAFFLQLPREERRAGPVPRCHGCRPRRNLPPRRPRSRQLDAGRRRPERPGCSLHARGHRR